MSQLSNAVFHVSFRLLQTKNHHLEEKNVKKTTLMNLLTCASLYGSFFLCVVFSYRTEFSISIWNDGTLFPLWQSYPICTWFLKHFLVPIDWEPKTILQFPQIFQRSWDRIRSLRVLRRASHASAPACSALASSCFPVLSAAGAWKIQSLSQWT